MHRKTSPADSYGFTASTGTLSVPFPIALLLFIILWREGEYQPYLPTNILRVAVKSPAVSVQK